MKKLILFLMLLPFAAYSQCTKCRSIEEALKAPEQVQSLTINGMMDSVIVDSVDKRIASLKNLRILYLSDHPITVFPVEVTQLKNLRELSLAGCELEKVPEEIFTMTHLKELVLVNNSFTPEYIEELKKKFAEKMPKTLVII